MTVTNNTLYNINGYGVLEACWNVPAAHTCANNRLNNNIMYSVNSSNYFYFRLRAPAKFARLTGWRIHRVGAGATDIEIFGDSDMPIAAYY